MAQSTPAGDGPALHGTRETEARPMPSRHTPAVSIVGLRPLYTPRAVPAAVAVSTGCSIAFSATLYPRAASATPPRVIASAPIWRSPSGSPSMKPDANTPITGANSTAVAAVAAGSSRRPRNHAR